MKDKKEKVMFGSTIDEPREEYSFPEYGITVWAKDNIEAVELLDKQLKHREGVK